MPRLNVLFVCSRNEWRSPTAERLYRDDRRIAVRSRGVSKTARCMLTRSDLSWADVVLVMEQTHRDRIRQQFARDFDMKRLRVLEIPDEYAYMDEELVELLKLRVDEALAGILSN